MKLSTLMLKVLVIFSFLTLLSACGGSDNSETTTPSPPTADTTPPVITLNGNASVSVGYGKEYIEAGAKAMDAVDGEVTVSISGEVNTTVPATYTITYTASDNSGNQSQQSRTVTVQEQRAFITTWDTSLGGISEHNQIFIDTEGEGFNYTIDWGDGKVDHNVKGDITHTYASSGVYSVAISGDFPHFYLAKVETELIFELPNVPEVKHTYKSDNHKLLSVEQWGDIIWHSMNSSFHDAINLTINATDLPNLSAVEDMSFAFAGISTFNFDLTDWNVSNVRNMKSLFERADSFNQDIGNWDVSKVTDMSAMFKDVRAFNQHIGGWNVSSVTNMKSMFEEAISFNQNISAWNVSNVTDMSYMFRNAYKFDQDISNWDVSRVTDMYSMFRYAISFDIALGDWQVTNVKSMPNMFEGVTLSTENYDATLLGWSSLQLSENIEFHGGNSKYSEKSAAARQSLIDQFNWTISDGGPVQ